ncbi:MAG: SRPBCC family protein [Actinomycetota bacterium]|nr:SRPBCC family protein [Actinomycetota bacterium]
MDESIEIARPAGEVARYMFDWRNDPEWIGGISEARLLTDGDFGIGSQVERVASFMGKRIEYVLEVEDYQPGALLAMQSVKAPFPMAVTYEVNDARDVARARVQVEGDASGFYRLAGPLLNLRAARSVAADLRRLKALLEAQERE